MSDKWKSRKFWLAVVGQVVGIVALIWGVQVSEQVAQVAGAVIMMATALGYLKVEGDIDKARLEK